MKNDNELFIGGDPRFLAGAAKCLHAATYDSRPVTVGDRPVATTRELGFGRVANRGIAAELGAYGVEVHKGRAIYHHRPAMNVFLRDGEWPSAGIELETEERPGMGRALEAALVSNWFHFEQDSSLGTQDSQGRSRSGYELITEPLPPRFYRNPRLWAGLQNILSPWTESWGFEETGLHVHVGVTQFEDMLEELDPLYSAYDRRMFAKYLVAYLYFAVLDRTFVDRVFLRKPRGYCNTPDQACDLFKWEPGLTGRQVADRLLCAILRYSTRLGDSSYRGYLSGMQSQIIRALSRSETNPAIDRSSASSVHLVGAANDFTGHHTELNIGNTHTVEFRRGKGTLNCVSILRMVEFATLLVRFAAKLLREPDTAVDPAGIYRYMIDNTTSGALKTLAEQQLKGE